MSDPRKDFVFRRDWKLLVAAILALALVIAVVAYKYTGDFTVSLNLEPADNRAAIRATRRGAVL
jgi:hypothetical protein